MKGVLTASCYSSQWHNNWHSDLACVSARYGGRGWCDSCAATDVICCYHVIEKIRVMGVAIRSRWRSA